MPPNIYWIHRRLSPTTGPIFNLRLGLDVPQDTDLISPHIMFAGMFIAAHAHRFSHGLGRINDIAVYEANLLVQAYHWSGATLDSEQPVQLGDSQNAEASGVILEQFGTVLISLR